MSNTKKIASIAFTGSAAVALTLMTANPALAASSWHVRNNGLSYKGVIKAKNKAGTSPSIKDTNTGTFLRCKNAVMSGSISKSKSAAASPKLGFLKKTTTKWSSCAVAGLKFKAHLTTSPALIAKSFSAGTHTMTGKLTGNKISVFISGIGAGNNCKAILSGTSVPLKYMNTPHSFSVNPALAVTLKVKATRSCLGAVNLGDKAYIRGTYHVSSPIALTITRSAS